MCVENICAVRGKTGLDTQACSLQTIDTTYIRRLSFSELAPQQEEECKYENKELVHVVLLKVYVAVIIGENKNN
jgi:hypothetical protein